MTRILSSLPHAVPVQTPSATFAKGPVQRGKRTFNRAPSLIRHVQTSRVSVALPLTGGNLKKRMVKQGPTPAVTLLLVATSKSSEGHAVTKPPGFDHSTQAKKSRAPFSSARGSQSRTTGQILKKGRIPLTPSIGKGKTSRPRIKEHTVVSQTKIPHQSLSSKTVSDEPCSAHSNTAIVLSDHPTVKK